MKVKKLVCVLLVVAAIMLCTSPATMAAGNTSGSIGIYATGSIRFDVQPHSSAISRTSMPLDVGDKVVIKAAYTPFSAGVDFGIVDENNQFYYVTITGGDVDIEITITQRGYYRFGVYNNSSSLISISGYINY